MVLIKEYRIPLPLTPQEFNMGHLYSIAKASEKETHGDAGVEILKNEAFENEELGKGQYTYKIYHLGSRLPGWVRAVAPSNALKLHEESWNAFPHTKTILTSPFMPDKFKYVIESRYFENDLGTQDNVFNLKGDDLKNRKVEFIDIITKPRKEEEYKADEDPCIFKSKKTGRGELVKGWEKDSKPVMCAYKLVTVECKVWGVQTKAEDFAHKTQSDIFLKFHRQLFCWIDDWVELTLEDIRRFEKDSTNKTNEKMTKIKEDSKDSNVESKEEKKDKEKKKDKK